MKFQSLSFANHMFSLGLSLLCLIGAPLLVANNANAKLKRPKKQALYSAPEIYSATADNTPEAETDDLTMDDISDKPKQPVSIQKSVVSLEDNDLQLDDLDQEEVSSKVTQKTKVSEIITEKTVMNDDPLADRLSALEQELSNFRKSAAPQAQQATVTEGGDIVPEQHKGSILKRIQLVEKLIQKHGLAYDYRSITTHQLEETLAKLDNESR